MPNDAESKSVKIHEKELSVPLAPDHGALLTHLEKSVNFHLADGEFPLRIAVTETTDHCYRVEVGVIEGLPKSEKASIFRFVQRKVVKTEKFNVVLLVPTGIGAEIGGHAGDATPVAQLLAQSCDTLVTHPNVVNASDINEIPDNALYVEGSVIARLMMGTAGLQPVRGNRVLIVMGSCEDEQILHAAVNGVSAARAAFGLICTAVVQLDPPLRMTANYTPSGRAAGSIKGFENLLSVLEEYRDDYDAVAITSVIDVPPDSHVKYFQSKGDMVNLWGGVEAMLTHAVSTYYDVPSAHAPMMESWEIFSTDPGITDPRMAAEAISTSFLQCILKGMQKSPRIISDPDTINHPGVFSVADVSCFVIPDGCLGLPTLAALEQDIPVIAVRENKNLMKNNLTDLPWARDQLHIVENYWESVGIINALKAGIDPKSVRRPITRTEVEKKHLNREARERLKDRSSSAG